MGNKKALSAVSQSPEDRPKWQMSLSQLSAFGHWGGYYKIKSTSGPNIYYKKLESLIGFKPQLDFLDKDIYKGKAWGLEYQNGLKCVITHSQFGTDLLVPRSYSQEELNDLLPQVLGSLKIQDSVEEYYAPFKE